MKKTIKHLLLLTGVLLSTGCTSLVLDVVDALDPNQMEDDWAHKGHLRKLMNHPAKQLLTEDEKKRAAKNICALKHLKPEDKNNEQLIDYAKLFCKLEQNDKIYFYNWCMDCGGGGERMRGTSYLLVRKKEPLSSIEIDTVYSKELGRTIPIIERLH